MRLVKTRWSLACACVVFSVLVMAMTLKRSDMGALFPIMLSVMSFVAAVLLVAPETAMKLAELCSRPVTNIVFPSERFTKPPLSYQIARRHRTMQRLEEALVEYQSIIENYPGEREAYLELLDVAAKLGDTKACEKYKARFKRQFGEEI